MGFEQFVESVSMPCCVISVEKAPDNGYGEIRIVCANDSYKKMMGPQYYDNMLYYELVPQDNKYEDFCYRAAVLGQRMHAYVETKALNCWTDQTLIPLASPDEDKGYCQFIFEFTQGAEADRMATVSADTSAAVIRACITLMGNDDLQDSLGVVLEDILETAGAQGCRIMLIDHQAGEAVNLCERIAPGAFPQKSEHEDEDVIDYDLIQTWEGVIGVSNNLIIKDEPDFAWLEEANPSWAASMRKNGVDSLILAPLRRNGVIFGYLYVVNFDTSRLVGTKELIELLSYFLASEISNQQLLEQLEVMSHTDGLTGLNNRNAMLRRMHELEEVSDVPVGVINLDLNGLKRVNDEQGHEAGDLLLVQAGEVLRKIFYQEDLFRTGGDEFIIIISGISEEIFDRKVNRLRGDAEKNAGVSFAIGAHWIESAADLQTAFRRADEKMYEDKEAFYRRHPECKRH